MEKRNWKPYVCWILLTEAVGALAGWLTRDGMEVYKSSIVKPFLSPPAIVFPIVWIVLYALMGVGAARITLTQPSKERTMALRIYGIQLAFNFVWTLLFFNGQAFGLALIWLIVLWLLILWMIFAFRRLDPLAAKLQIPYLLWVAFAGYLNAGVWLLNR